MASVTCGNCNAAISKDSKFCGNCGNEKSGEIGKQRKTSDPSSLGLGSDAMAIINAINMNTDKKVGELQTEVKSLHGEVREVKTELVSTNARIDQTNCRIDKSDQRIDALENQMKSKMVPDSAKHKYGIPRNKRTTVVVGGFKPGTDKHVIEAKLKEITQECKDDVRESFCPAKLCHSIGKIDFKDNDKLWSFLKANKGRRFQHNGEDLWHNIDSTKDERTLSKRVNEVVKRISEHITQKGQCSSENVKNFVSGDGDHGQVYYKPMGTPLSGEYVKIFERDGMSTKLKIGPDAQKAGLEFDLGACLSQVNALE